MNPIEMLAFLLITAAVLLVLYKLYRGPTVHDRLVAADTLGVTTTAGLVWLTSIFSNPIYLDVSLLYGALAFVGVVAVARALEGKPS